MFKQEEILERLLPLLKIRSVKAAPLKNAPFGEGAKKALDYVLSLANDMGFETVNYDNYVGEVIFGEGKPFGVLCHLDVVPEGELSAWTTPPYEPTIRDGKLFARGAVDDKSPAISVLSAILSTDAPRLNSSAIANKRSSVPSLIYSRSSPSERKSNLLLCK